jgi:hypothetical protein
MPTEERIGEYFWIYGDKNHQAEGVQLFFNCLFPEREAGAD